ncbi:MAG: hypothetical protein KC457_10240 [Myxococcales bacterium]|nr:hypothetical protein [Myxococcales bacterium]
MKSALTLGAVLLGLASASSCKDPEPENFGTVRIELAPLGGDLTIFDGTTQVVATVNYFDECLQNFYLSERTEYQQDGTEGAAVFDRFTEILCNADQTPACEIEAIEQTLLENTMVYNLKVTYTITDPGTLAYSELSVGPVPTEDFAGCKPIVELRQNGLIGRSSDGVQIWRIASLPGSALAATNQGAPLRVDIVRQ